MMPFKAVTSWVLRKDEHEGRMLSLGSCNKGGVLGMVLSTGRVFVLQVSGDELGDRLKISVRFCNPH